MKNLNEINAEIAFDASYNCAQSVLFPFLKQYGLREEDGFKIASAFGAGMAGMQGTCGAVTGAFMVLGLEYGFVDPKDKKQRELLLVKTREFILKFKNEYGTIKCRDILLCDLNTEEGKRKHKEENQRELICKNCVRHSVKILGKMIG